MLENSIYNYSLINVENYINHSYILYFFTIYSSCDKNEVSQTYIITVFQLFFFLLYDPYSKFYKKYTTMFNYLQKTLGKCSHNWISSGDTLSTSKVSSKFSSPHLYFEYSIFLSIFQKIEQDLRWVRFLFIYLNDFSVFFYVYWIFQQLYHNLKLPLYY